MIEGFRVIREDVIAASIQWRTGERGALPAELLAQLRLADPHQNTSFGALLRAIAMTLIFNRIAKAN